MRVLASPRLWFTLVIIWFAVLYWLSSESNLHPPGPEFMHKDKVMHAGYFTLGGALFFIGVHFKKNAPGLMTASLLTIIFCSAVGRFDEWHQQFTPGRSANDFWDWMADTLGGVLGALCGHLLLRWFSQSRAVNS